MRIGIKGLIVPNDDAWIYDLLEYESTSPKAVEDMLQQAETTGEDVDIDINSPGGDVFSASEIYSAIRAHKGTVNIHVVGIAASAASVIACAAHSDIAPTAQMMVHRVSTSAYGNVNDLAHVTDQLEHADRAIAAAYVAKSGMSEHDALDMMDAETWLTAQDAVDYGLIDEIAQPADSSAKAGTTVQMAASVTAMLPPDVIAKMQQKKKKLEAELSLMRLKGVRK